MRYALRIIAAWLLLAVVAHAQSPTLPGFPPGTFQNRAALDAGGAAAYSGPGNVISSAIVWWGLRAYTSALRGNNLINICEPTGVTCVDWKSDATTGALVATTNPVGGTDCTSVNTCVVGVVYDQLGSVACVVTCNVVNLINAQRPTLTWNCVGGKPCLVFVRAATQFLAGGNITSPTAAPYSIAAVAERTGNTGSYQGIVGGNNSGIDFDGGPNSVVIFAGTVNSTAANDNVWHAIQGRVASGAGAGFANVSGVDSASGSVTTGTGTLDATAVGSVGGSLLDGRFAEGGWWAGDQSASFAALASNQRTYWGF